MVASRRAEVRRRAPSTSSSTPEGRVTGPGLDVAQRDIEVADLSTEGERPNGSARR